jgi:hypothetical protein
MMDPRYLRARAQRCLELAEQISDNQAADGLRKQAADYLARAVRLEEEDSADLSLDRKLH